MKKDIETEGDIKLLVDEFYGLVRKDELLSPVFNTFINDWDKHLERLYSFWNTVLLGKSTYHGNPLMKHIKMPIQKEHFDQWLKLFLETLKANFEGPNTNSAYAKAQSIAGIMQSKMSSIRTF